MSAEDAVDYGPVAYATREHAFVFDSAEEAGRWADAHAEYGDFVIRTWKGNR